MTVFEDLNSKNIDELVEWFEENCLHDSDPCIKWFDKTYCQNCEAVEKDGMEYAYCELNGKCRYFKDMDSVPDNKQTIKMWLESDAKCTHNKQPITLDEGAYDVEVEDVHYKWHIVPVREGNGFTYLCVGKDNNYLLQNKAEQLNSDVECELSFDSEKEAQSYIDSNLDNKQYQPELYWRA